MTSSFPSDENALVDSPTGRGPVIRSGSPGRLVPLAGGDWV